MQFVWVLLIGFGLMAGTLALVMALQRRRARLLREAGAALGLRPYEKGEHLSVPSVEILRKPLRSIGAVVEGTWNGQQILAFDLSYPAGKSSSRTTVFCLRLPAPRIPEFAAIRKNIWLYSPTVDLPRLKDPPNELRQHWFLYTPSGQWPFDEQISQVLTESTKWSFEGRGSALFLYQRAKRVSPRALGAWLDEALEQAQEFMRFVPETFLDANIDDSDATFTHKQSFTFKASWRIQR